MLYATSVTKNLLSFTNYRIFSLMPKDFLHNGENKCKYRLYLDAFKIQIRS